MSNRAIASLLQGAVEPPATVALAFNASQYQAASESLFLGAVHLASLVLPAMMKRQFGRIMTIGSSGIIEPIENLAISSAIRPAVAGWCKSAAREVASSGVTVNLLVPGRIFTDRVVAIDAGNATRKGRTVEEVQWAAWDRIPVGRYGTTPEFAAAAFLLASQQAGFMTGSVLRVAS